MALGPPLTAGSRSLSARHDGGAAPLGFKGAGLTLLFPDSSRIHRNHSTALIAVQPSFSTIRCKTLNIFIKVCYSLLCLSKPIRARLPCPLIEAPTGAGIGSALSHSLLLFFSSLTTAN